MENNIDQYSVPTTTILTSILISHLFNLSLDVYVYLRVMGMLSVHRQNDKSEMCCLPKTDRGV